MWEQTNQREILGNSESKLSKSRHLVSVTPISQEPEIVPVHKDFLNEIEQFPI